ncbi:LysR family transcriptional regulator [Sphingoaurantiacus capsulatus]|uniref:LysR family transcriptional regulator n=1 Tax=Sphingoaurantiacus capsulatus TaxID=1771310 RepID=A0ABV7X766_9SPHN
MNWDDLRVFLALARAPTLATAAVKLGIDATTVGRRLRRLEANLDAALFEPGAGGQTLTEAGRRLLVYAEGAEQAATQAKSELAGERGLLAGTIRVSIAEGLGTWLIARHLGDFHAANPAIRVELVATNGFLNPSKREADLAIMLARPARGPLIAKKLADYRLKLYAARTYAERHGLPARARDLNDHALVGYIPDFIYAEELRYLDEVADGLEPALASSSINVQHELVRSGAGLGILPCFIGEQDAELVRVLDAEVAVTRSFWRVVHRDVARLARVRAFTDWLDALVTEQRELLLG